MYDTFLIKDKRIKMQLNKWIIMMLVFVVTYLQAGEFDGDCYNKFNKYEVDKCLEEKQKKIQEKLDEKLFKLLKVNGEFSKVTSRDIQKSTLEFENYIEKQCELIYKITTGSGVSHTVTDCKIKMTQQRIESINYIISNF